MDFIWDIRKGEANTVKHGILFNVAITAFDDPFQLRAPDLKHSTPSEIRQWLIGKADVGVLVIPLKNPPRLSRVIFISRRLSVRPEQMNLLSGI